MLRRLCFFATACLFLTAAHAQDGDQWDVNAAFGPTKEVRFTTTEGTWMNLDVSPDGQTIVFDLLGDLYTLPITGGTATAITSGPAFDLQPRFSPDGSQISFTSDRAGGDNIWVMDADGSNPRQITKETFRLLNNATWTPDGQYLVARKHFTSTRSLGAGEMWMYHVGGGSAGLQLTKRKNNQQDAGEPEMSPDGRYLYFSEDMSGGSTFQYNKDPNGQIYVIRRLDLETGDLTNYVTGQGGSARPEVSPDGRYIAFVRRVRAESVLYLHDTQTGGQRPLFDGLSHDQQEAWAIFGVYTNFAWTPDGQHLVFWAQGHLWKLNVATRDLAQIPFTVDVERTVVEALRYVQDVHPAQFTAKMIRDAATSPDGRTLVFHAVGHLWKKTLPNGTPTRLTNSEHFEYEPDFSPDGRHIVYTTWSDQNLGAVYRVPLRGGRPEKLTNRPGHYRTPRYARDGGKIVYQRTTGNGLLGTLHGVEPGLYWMPASGGDGTLITRSGREPRFDATGGRVFFLTGGGLSKKYKSIDLDGSDERTHFDLKYVNDVVPSPDGHWIAFTELYHAYVAPFPKTGGEITLNKDTKAMPLQQVTRDAGTYLHWSADSQRLHWMIGPEYYTREIRDSFAFVDGAPDELPPADSVGTPVGLTLPSAVPQQTVAFVGARIITMNGDEVIENGTLIVEGNRIRYVGPSDGSGAATPPAGAHVVQAQGKTIMPGIVDVHGHGSHFGSGPSPQQNWVYYANLAFGVTTMHDPSATTAFVFSQAELVQAGEIVGPRIYSTGTILYGADGDFKATVNSLEDARSHLRRMKAVGAISVKSYNQPRRDQRQQVLQAARELEMMVVPEGGSTFFHNITMIIDGHTGIEHNLPIAPLYDDVLSLWAENEVGYTPTLVVTYSGPSGENYFYQHTNVWENDRLLNFTPRSLVDARSRRRVMMPDEEYHHIVIAESGKKLVDRGGKMQVGAHGQLQGLAAHWEMWMFAQGGMTPHEVLRAATYDGAYYIGLHDDLGSLETGKLADLLVLDQNPLDDIRHTESITHVMINGRLYDAMTMHEVGPNPQERQPFHWERDDVNDAFIWHGPTTTLGLAGPTCSCGRH